MGTYFKMSLAYLRKNKLRTSLLILGVVLGIVLIFGTSVIKDSQNKNDLEAIHKLYGGYHVEFNDLNSDGVEKLKNDENVSKTTTVQNLGSVIDKKGSSVLLRSTDKNYISGKENKLIGRLPKNNNEIVIEKKALDEMGVPYELNSILDLTVKKKYKDSEGNNQIYIVDKKFKLVGIVEKPLKYYDVVWEYEAFTYVNDGKNNIIPPETVTYNSILNLKSGVNNLSEQIENIMQKNKLGKFSYVPNVQLVQKSVDIEIENDNPDAYKREVLIIIAAAIFIFNMFNITLNQTIKEMGLLRLIGSSKKNVRCMIIYQALIVMIVGTILGLILGVIYSYVGINTYNISLYKEASIDPKLYVSNTNIIKATIIGVFSVFISCIIPIFKIGNISPIEATKKAEKVKSNNKSYRLNKLLSKIFGFYGFMGLKNIGRNKSRALISMISIALGGYLFITTFSSMRGEVSNKIEDMQNRYDITMQFGAASDVDNLKYTDSDVNKITSIDGVKSVNAIQIVNGFFDFKKNEVNKEFIKYNGIQEKDQMEHTMDLKLYGDNYINETLKNFVEDGNLDDIGKVTDGYPNVAVYNYFYDSVEDSTYKNVFENLKVGDIKTIKVPITEDNKTVYKESKVRVCATLKPEWMSKGDGGFGHNFEIIKSNNHSKELTGEQKYTKLGINLEDPYDKTVNKKVEKVSNSIHLSKFDSRLSFNEMAKASSDNYIKSQISIIMLVLIIASINIFCTIRTNLLIRKNEISTLRAIGLSVRNMKKMVIYEALAYAILSFIIALIASTIYLIWFVNIHNNAYINFGIEHFMSFTFPVKESIIFFIISATVCLIAVATSSSDLKKVSIIEGIKDKY
ncbi:ABC transporter permease [Romboutsia sedimentorum]|uniref:ABC transporter permease n=1 Tax=Romboutsia sedimentorum TaxID=1368474 RepID=A0ABT7EB70_9FIRM|nr:ABC transporter permease [Romboutsia sedimentorum]MDK2564176.1 ABC transporter permease [Romboutsia sedimentorum]